MSGSEEDMMNFQNPSGNNEEKALFSSSQGPLTDSSEIDPPGSKIEELSKMGLLEKDVGYHRQFPTKVELDGTPLHSNEGDELESDKVKENVDSNGYTSTDILNSCASSAFSLEGEELELNLVKERDNGLDPENGKSEEPEKNSFKRKKGKFTVKDHLARLEKLRKSSMYMDGKCPVCEKSLSDPRILNCLHTFCLGCLTCDEQDANDGDSMKRVTCSLCLFKTVLPEGSISQLPKNHILVGFRDGMDGIHLCEVCKLHEKETEATGFCFDCKDYLCQECWNMHKFTKFTLHHKVSALDDDACKGIDHQFRVQEKLQCQLHPDEDLKYFCDKCEVNVCTDCLLLDHQNHPCVSLKQAFFRCKRNFDLLLQGVEDRIHRVPSMDDIEDDLKELSQTEEKQVEKISSTVQNLIENIKSWESKAIESLTQKFQFMRNQCQIRKISSQGVLFHLQETKNMADRFTTLSSDDEFMALEELFCKRMVKVINMQTGPEPLSYFTEPEIELNPQSFNTKGKMTPLFKITDFTLTGDVMKDLPCIGNLKDLAQDKKKWKELGFTDHGAELVKKWDGVKSAAQDEEVPEGAVKKEKKQKAKETKVENKTSSEEGGTKKKNRRSKRKENALQNEKRLNDGSVTSKGLVGDPFVRHDGFGLGIAASSGMYSSSPSLYNPLRDYGFNAYQGAGLMMNHSNMAVDMSSGGFYTENAPKMTEKPEKVNPLRKKDEKKMPKQAPVVVLKTDKKKPVAKAEPKVSQICTITPKWRLDVRTQTDKEVPYITGVHPVLKNKVVVADSNNNMIKIFSIEGEFLNSFKAVNPTSVTFASGIMIWTTEQKVVIMEQNEEFKKEIDFQRSEIPHPLSWYPQSQFVVACGNHLRVYHVNKEKEAFTNQQKISFQLPHQQTLSNIFSVKSNGNGKKLVMTDWDLRAIVIGDSDGKVTGIYYGDKDNVWYPGGACFDSEGNVFGLDYSADRLLLLDDTGELLQEWNTAPTITKPWSVVCGAGRQLFITGSDHYVHVYQYSYE